MKVEEGECTDAVVESGERRGAGGGVWVGVGEGGWGGWKRLRVGVDSTRWLT